MGHTVPSKRIIMYKKLEELLRFAKTLRNPYRDRFIELVKSVYLNISGMVYTNSLDDDEMMVYAMLARLSHNLTIENKEKILRCFAILIAKREGEIK